MRYFLLFIIIFSFQIIKAQDSSIPSPPKNTDVFKETITFYAKDSVQITADTYFLEDVPPTILLCHQAGFSRGEYIDTARKLNDLGFSCLAIDQRSGKEVNGIFNLTARDADAKKMNVGYAGAKQDVEAAIDYLYNSNGKRPIILVGSSYSASLALWIGSESKKLKAIAAFSPGEYLKGIDLAKTIKPLQTPTFLTSSKREIMLVEKLVRKVNPKYITHFKPEVKGIHGSRALWKATEGHESYWNAFKSFLLKHK